MGVVGTPETAQIGVYAGTCDSLAPEPVAVLEPVQTETMSSVTNLELSFDKLTDGAHAIAIRAGAVEGAAVLACNEIPNKATETTE